MVVKTMPKKYFTVGVNKQRPCDLAIQTKYAYGGDEKNEKPLSSWWRLVL